MIWILGRNHARLADGTLARGDCGNFFLAQSLLARGICGGCSAAAIGKGGGRQVRDLLVFAAFEHASHGGRGQVEAGTGERLGDLDLAHRRTEGLQPAHDVADELRELVDRWRRQLHEGRLALFVDPLKPRGDRRGGDEECSRRLFQGPVACGLHFQDSHAFGGRIMRAARRGLLPAGVLDADLFAKEFDFLVQTVVFGLQAYAGVEAIGRPAAGMSDGELGQGNDVKDGGLDGLGEDGGRGIVGALVLAFGMVFTSRRILAVVAANCRNLRDAPCERTQEEWASREREYYSGHGTTVENRTGRGIVSRDVSWQRAAIVRDDADRQQRLDWLQRTVATHGWRLHASSS